MKCITKSILPMYEQLVWFSLKVQSWLLFYNVMNRIDSEKRPVLLIILKINWSSTLFIPHLHWMIFISHAVLICMPIYFIKKVSISNFWPSSFHSWLWYAYIFFDSDLIILFSFKICFSNILLPFVNNKIFKLTIRFRTN